ncbi:roadblock/LC7 domain-containing protein [Planctomycetota bacterium]
MTENEDKTRSYAIQKREYDFEAIVLNIRSVKGLQTSVVVDMSGEVIAENNPKGTDIESLTQAIFDVARLVNQSTKELGIGRFHTGEFDGPWGHIFLSILNDKMLITQCDASAPGEDVLARIDRIIESCSRETDG